MNRIILFLVFTVVICSSTIAQEKFGLYTTAEWQTKIDSKWGAGLPTLTKLRIFDEFWKTIDEEYPSFHNINVNWDSLRTVFRPEVIGGVSRGRFYAIMSQLFFSLRDFHTRMVDISIARTELKKGVPLLVPWGYWDVGHFGAALAPNPDSSLFVYKVVDNHPLDLKVGDIILGYEGIEWKKLYKLMYDKQFPLAASMNLPFKKAVWGTTPSAHKHIWLCSAGMNWHLFDTINIVKYTTKDTMNLPTSLLENQNMELVATGQMPVPGVEMPDIYNGHSISYGIIEGTSIGYIYNYGWHPGVWKYSPGDEYREAVISLKESGIQGLIIDARNTEGGEPSEVQKVYPLLFNEDWNLLNIYVRTDPQNYFRLSLTIDERLSYSSNTSYFDIPIAVLTGPVAQSMGDIVPLIFKSHPRARLFGLPTNGAFGHTSPNFNKSYGGEKWEEWITLTNMSLKENSAKYLTHIGYPIDEEVWLKLDDVVNGDDTVVKKALDWINNIVGVEKPLRNGSFDTFALIQNYPNPFNPSTVINYQIPSSVMLNSIQHLNNEIPEQVRNDNPHVTLKIYDILGREVATLANQKQKPGNYEVTWDATDKPSGVYFYKLSAGDYVETRKMILLR